MEAIVGSKGASKIVDTLGEFSSTVSRIQDAYGSLRTVIRGATVSPAKQFALKGANEIADRATSLSRRALKGALERLSSVKQLSIRELTAELDQRVLRVVGDEGLDGRLVAYLSETGQDGVNTLNRIDADRIPNVLGTLDDFRLTRALAERDVPIRSLQDNLDIDVSSSSARRVFGAGDGDGEIPYSLVRGRFRSTYEDVNVGIRHVKEKQRFIDEYIEEADTPELRKGSIGENVADDIAAAKGYRTLGPDDGFRKDAANDIGIDNIARKDDGTFVVTESKFTSNERIGYDLIETSAYGSDAQLRRQWLLGAVDEMESRGILTDEFPIEEFRRQIRRGEVEKELVVVRDADAPSQTLRSPQSAERALSDVGIESVEIVDLPSGPVDFSPAFASALGATTGQPTPPKPAAGDGPRPPTSPVAPEIKVGEPPRAIADPSGVPAGIAE